MMTRPYLLHALSPLHAGTGQAASVIDLPIARLRSTGIPFVPGSSIKGVLRAARRPAEGDRAGWEAVFGPENVEESANDYAGALVVSDARLLALPVRSFRGTFAFVTSPLLLELARRDLGDAAPRIAALDGAQAQAIALTGEDASLNVHVTAKGARVFLEDLDLAVQQSEGGADGALATWARLLSGWLGAEELRLARRLLLVDDDTMNFLWETATQVDTRVRLDPRKRTVARGALWVEESLPSESLLVGVLAAEHSRSPRQRDLDPRGVLTQALPAAEVLQFGGKASVGRGRCSILPGALRGQGA